MRGIKHHSFDVVLSGWYGSQMIGYMRQLLAKVDGADPIYKMGGFFKDNMEFESWYDSSPFRSSDFAWEDEKMSLKKFSSLIYANSSNGKWEKSAFHPALCYLMQKELIENSQDDKLKNFRDDWRVPAASKGKATSTLCPTA
jgi:hypothetical protein